MSSLRFLPILALALSSSAFAQSFNVDVGANVAFPLPTATYAAAGLAGTWNNISAVPTTAQPLVDLAGAATPVTLTRSGGGAANFDFNNAGTLGDDQNLMDDCQDVGAAPTATTTWTFANLAAGSYTLITYAWAPDSATFVTTVNGVTAVGGAWPGGFTLGVTHSVDSFPSVTAGGSIAVTLTATSGFGSGNGFQLKKNASTPATGFCFGDGTGTLCPCGNAGIAGNGCANSLVASGGNLAGSGLASVAADTFTLTGTGMPNSSALYFQGSAQIAGGAGSVFGDGLRCVTTQVIRLGTKSNVAGGSQYPVGADIKISVKGLISGNVTRYYQCWYRNAASFCAPETFNLTNGVGVTWIP